MNSVCVIYGGNANLINSIKNELKKTFSSVVMIVRERKYDDDNVVKYISYSQISDIKSQIIDEVKGKKIFFISAAAYTSDKLFISETKDSVEKSFQVNLFNNIELLQMLMSEAIKVKCGTFLFISSFRSDIPTIGTSLYSSSKKYMESLFTGLAIEYSRFKLRFMSLKIGLYEGGLTKNLPFNIESEKIVKENISVGRVSNAKDIISAIRFIHENEYINGTQLDMTGKLTIDLKS
jgi:short-subunit dehydrogenase